MPTKTKAKMPNLEISAVEPLKLSLNNKKEILSALGLDEASEEEQKIVIEDLERVLSLLRHRQRHLRDKPMPAHSRVLMKEIVAGARQLADKLDDLHFHTHFYLMGTDTLQLQMDLLGLAFAATAPIDLVSGKGSRSDGGAQKAREAETRQNNRAALCKFFDVHAQHMKEDIITDCRQDFIEECERFIALVANTGINYP